MRFQCAKYLLSSTVRPLVVPGKEVKAARDDEVRTTLWMVSVRDAASRTLSTESFTQGMTALGSELKVRSDAY